LHKCIANGFDKAIPFCNTGNLKNAGSGFPLHKRSFMQSRFAPRVTTFTKKIRPERTRADMKASLASLKQLSRKP
jgi:hypothetical protein